VECSVADNGCAAEGAQPGRGLKIVQSLARGLNGRLDHRFGACGTIVTLSFPLVETEPDHVDGNRLDLTGEGRSGR
jgi:two-component sensor histidine kinase